MKSKKSDIVRHHKGLIYKFLAALFTISAGIFFSSCSELDEDELTSYYGEHSFNFSIGIENFKGSYHQNDTLWFSMEIPQQLTSTEGKSVMFENASFLFSGFIDQLNKDMASYPQNNFILIMKDGDLVSIGAYSDMYNYYTLETKFGAPYSNNKLTFGMVLLGKGIFAGKSSVTAYFGPHRTNYNDFSPANQIGYINLKFNIDNTFAGLLEKLNSEEKLFWKSTYNETSIANKSIIIFEVTD